MCHSILQNIVCRYVVAKEMCLLDAKTQRLVDNHFVVVLIVVIATSCVVQQQLLAETDFLPFYWAGPSNEVDFVFQYGTGVMPLEVKAETNLRARSLMYFCRKNRIPMAVRSSMIDYRVDWTDTIPSVPMDGEEFKFLLANLPLYALASLPAVCEELARRADKGQGG